MDTIGSERLLVHHLGDGWERLYRWLQLSVPETEYQSGNIAET